MPHMQPRDNDANDGEDKSPTNGSHSENLGQFTLTCGRCGSRMPLAEKEEPKTCGRCGASIGSESDVLVSFQPGPTPAIRWLGRGILAAIAVMLLLTAWALIFRRAR